MDAQRQGVLVAVDRSECSREAVTWAAHDAAARGCGLTLAHVVDLPRIADVPLTTELLKAASGEGEQTLDQAVVHSRRVRPGGDTQRKLASGNPAAELLRLAADADEVVLGSRGHGGFATLLLGSTAAQVSAHAPCPAIVVRGHAAPDGPVVVAVDGSERGEAALEYGFAYAARHGLPLRAVHFYPVSVTVPAYGLPPLDLPNLHDEASHMLAKAVDRWSAKHPEVPVTWAVREGAPAHRVHEASEGANLLVVGCRGHGGFAGMLLGSVSQAAIRHSHCPVAIAH
jgi:nucleotide-binding universal stress UspA family protein